jgi:Flp pilus assembly protein TadG
MMSRLSLLLRERAGNVTIELALLAPLLGAMLIGLIDISTAFSDKLRLEQVAQRTIEKVMQNSFLVSQAPTLKAEAEAEAGAGAVATVSWWLECDGKSKRRW